MYVLRRERADFYLSKALSGPSSAILKPSRDLLGLAEAVLWASWAPWEPGNHVPGEASGNMISNDASWAFMGPSWGPPGPASGPLGPSWG
eukprot:1173083-Pyramimonas_sp.AAC.1